MKEIDLFANPPGSFNMTVMGRPGSGKSVLMEELAMSYLGTGARVRVADVILTKGTELPMADADSHETLTSRYGVR